MAFESRNVGLFQIGTSCVLFSVNSLLRNCILILPNSNYLNIKGSRKWERRGVRIVANVRYQVSDRGDRYLFTFWTCRFCVQIQFPFPFVITKWIGDYFDNRLCAANFGASIYSRVTNMIDLFCRQMAMRIKFGAPFFNHIYLADLFPVRAASLFTLRTFGAQIN